MTFLIIVFIILAALYMFVLIRPRLYADYDKRLDTDYAHRGLHGAGVPENSLAAFERAVACGYGIELDVQLSRDGEVMVFHDYTLNRMTDREGKLSDFSSDELASMHLADTSETIPRLRDVLALVDGRVPLLIELKGESTDVSLCEPLCRLLSEYNGVFCIESFNPILLGEMAKLMPHVYRGILYTNLCREKKKYSLIDIALTCMLTNIIARPDFIAYDKKYRKSFALWLCTRLYHTSIYCWTVKSRTEWDIAKENKQFTIFENFQPK